MGHWHLQALPAALCLLLVLQSLQRGQTKAFFLHTCDRKHTVWSHSKASRLKFKLQSEMQLCLEGAPDSGLCPLRGLLPLPTSDHPTWATLVEPFPASTMTQRPRCSLRKVTLVI